MAAAAGVTSGAFYSNFPNKEALLEGVIEACLGKSFIDSTGAIAERRELLRTWLHEYISAYHRENPAVGCVMPTLSADVARASPAVRETYKLKMLELICKVSTVLGGAEEDREQRAWSIVAMMVGSIGISRAMPDGDAANCAIEHALETAVSLIG
ncbi:TetR/AcrR family transcriptional regulator [Roseixanthobacter pseudopolyaromaticivorans]|uniref:TetR/AcrR family transcriptional regulator n=1 Tax=Xanthobacteraceae TaxID=335928 RepID=UPI00372BC406